MKINLPLMKLIIRLLIILILFVLLFMLSAFLYSARYWPDVYNYINANITIKRIPTLTELNLTIITVYHDAEYTTEFYRTTDFEATDNTMEPEDDFTDNFEDFFPERKRRNVVVEDIKDYSELPRGGVVDYVFYDEPTTGVIRDSVDENKLTTRQWNDVVMISRRGNVKLQEMKAINQRVANLTALFPWIAAIFVKNETNNQFDYVCDGALLSEIVIVTAALCVSVGNAPLNTDDVIIILGRTSLGVARAGEMIHKVKQVKLHDDFKRTGDKASNDIAVLVLDELTVFSSAIQPASRSEGNGEEEAVTTAWGISGALTPIVFQTGSTETCAKIESPNTFCARYGNDIALCPSFGGIYAARRTNQWHLLGIRTADTTNRGFCIDKTVQYTSLEPYSEWISKIVDANTN